MQHMASSQWFPAVAELRQQAGALWLLAAQTAIEAWGVGNGGDGLGPLLPLRRWLPCDPPMRPLPT